MPANPSPPSHSGFATPTNAPLPRSQDNSPARSGQPPMDSLHYGNRNMTPLFKAARADPARVPSSLRREFSPLSFDSAEKSSVSYTQQPNPPHQQPNGGTAHLHTNPKDFLLATLAQHQSGGLSPQHPQHNLKSEPLFSDNLSMPPNPSHPSYTAFQPPYQGSQNPQVVINSLPALGYPTGTSHPFPQYLPHGQRMDVHATPPSHPAQSSANHPDPGAREPICLASGPRSIHDATSITDLEDILKRTLQIGPSRRL